MARTVQCVYLKKEAEGLDFSPYPGELGKRIYDNVSKEAFEMWKRHQTMLVNENRLNLADARARQYLARQMERFFFGEGADQPDPGDASQVAKQCAHAGSRRADPASADGRAEAVEFAVLVTGRTRLPLRRTT